MFRRGGEYISIMNFKKWLNERGETQGSNYSGLFQKWYDDDQLLRNELAKSYADKYGKEVKQELWLESEVLAHIAGASGSGKTTLGHKIASNYSGIVVKDLDEFDEEAEEILGYSDVRKKDYTDEMLSKLAKKRQQLMDDFIKTSNKPIVFVGHHTEGDHVLYVPTKNKFLLNVDAKTSAWRAYQRSQKEDPKYRRTLEELPQDEKEAEETINWLLDNGYKPLSHDQILKWMLTNYGEM